jgi:hypothetical protein
MVPFFRRGSCGIARKEKPRRAGQSFEESSETNDQFKSYPSRRPASMHRNRVGCSLTGSSELLGEMHAPQAVFLIAVGLDIAEAGIAGEVLGHALIGKEADRRVVSSPRCRLGESDEGVP